MKDRRRDVLERECVSEMTATIFEDVLLHLFLRPPPPPLTTGSINLTPQIVRDLRTKPFPGAQDIHHAWLSSTEPFENTQGTPRKLTTWNQTVAYKGISIALPLNARPRQSWRLLLSPSTSSQDVFVSLKNVRSTGRESVPVTSMPIRITPKPEKNPAKPNRHRSNAWIVPPSAVLVICVA